MNARLAPHRPHLDELEAESIHIFREVAASFQRPVMLYSIGKHSSVLLHLLPGVVQQNQPWLLLALPCWIALAWSLRRTG